jgi:hypothetical protein
MVVGIARRTEHSFEYFSCGAPRTGDEDLCDQELLLLFFENERI